jgi:hypothetical protein
MHRQYQNPHFPQPLPPLRFIELHQTNVEKSSNDDVTHNWWPKKHARCDDAVHIFMVKYET